MKTAASTSGLTFDWPRREGFPFVLFGCVAISLLAHVVTFFLFQVAEPPGTTIPHPAPRVSVLTPSSPEADSLLQWIDAQDPALAATPAPPGLPDTAYRPSYAMMRTSPLGPVETPVAVPFPPVREPLAVITSGVPRPALRPVPGTPQSTVVTFSAALESRAPTAFPSLVPKTRATEPVEPTRHLFGVTGDGTVRFVFLQSSSGNAALDEQAAAHLQTLSFQPADAPIIWATTTVTWGADAYGENPQSTIRHPPSP